LEEVIVTAQKQEENIQTVPLAITAMTSAQLESMGVTDFSGVAAASPSITFVPYPGSSNTLILYMRAQGSENPMSISSDGSVGLYEDGFYIARPQASTFDLADVERVEILRGPQGTLYGRNTTGGAVNLVSKQPQGEFGVKQEFRFGTRNLFRSLTAIDLPRAGDLAAKVTLLKSSTDGYVKNPDSSHDFGEQSQQAGRLILHWDVSDDVLADYAFEEGKLASTPDYWQNPSLNGSTINGYAYTGADRPLRRAFTPIDLDESTADFEGHGLTLSWDLADNLTLKSLTGYRTLDFDAFQVYADAFTLPPAPGTPYVLNTRDLIHSHQFSEELQLAGSNAASTVNYVAGLYYFKEGSSHLQTVDIPDFGQTTDGDVKVDSESQAAFGQVTWIPPVLDERFEVTVGARYTRDQKTAERLSTANGAVSEISPATTLRFSRFNPSLTLNYRWTDDLSVYGKISTGYRAGGFYEAAPIGQFSQSFAPEKLTNYELGLKSYWLDHRVRFNLAVFEAEYDDKQLTVQSNPLNPADSQVYNAASATIDGVEASLLLQPIDDLTISLDYAYLDAYFDKVDVIPGSVFDNAVNSASPYHVGDNIKDVFVMPFAPKNSISVAVDYTLWHFNAGALDAHLDYKWQDKVYNQGPLGPSVPGRDFGAMDPYGVINGRLTLSLDLPRGDHAKFGIWGKNLGNKQYVTSTGVNGNPFAVDLGGGVIPAGYYSGVTTWSEPPSYGIDLTYEYQ
jgi:iron complex outermembrane receptor protein